MRHSSPLQGGQPSGPGSNSSSQGATIDTGMAEPQAAQPPVSTGPPSSETSPRSEGASAPAETPPRIVLLNPGTHTFGTKIVLRGHAPTSTPEPQQWQPPQAAKSGSRALPLAHTLDLAARGQSAIHTSAPPSPPLAPSSNNPAAPQQVSPLQQPHDSPPQNPTPPAALNIVATAAATAQDPIKQPSPDQLDRRIPSASTALERAPTIDSTIPAALPPVRVLLHRGAHSPSSSWPQPSFMPSISRSLSAPCLDGEGADLVRRAWLRGASDTPLRGVGATGNKRDEPMQQSAPLDEKVVEEDSEANIPLKKRRRGWSFGKVNRQDTSTAHAASMPTPVAKQLAEPAKPVVQDPQAVTFANLTLSSPTAISAEKHAELGRLQTIEEEGSFPDPPVPKESLSAVQTLALMQQLWASGRISELAALCSSSADTSPLPLLLSQGDSSPTPHPTSPAVRRSAWLSYGGLAEAKAHKQTDLVALPSADSHTSGSDASADAVQVLHLFPSEQQHVAAHEAAAALAAAPAAGSGTGSSQRDAAAAAAVAVDGAEAALGDDPAIKLEGVCLTGAPGRAKGGGGRGQDGLGVVVIGPPGGGEGEETVADALARGQLPSLPPLKLQPRPAIQVPRSGLGDSSTPSSSSLPKQQTPAAGAEPATAAAEGPAAPPGAAAGANMQLWAGNVKHRLGTSTVELFHLAMLVPEKYAEQLPPTLFVSHLAPRNTVKLVHQVMLRCRLDLLEEKQVQKLQMLASLKLVALCNLQHCTIVLVPYTDAHNSLRVIGFLLTG